MHNSEMKEEREEVLHTMCWAKYVWKEGRQLPGVATSVSDFETRTWEKYWEYEIQKVIVRSEVLTAVVMKNFIY
jgi:hypothetical protein